jgi:sigma-E factor negative regulatory protein RseA
MTDRIREQMSALLDGELPQDEVGLLVRRLERDTVLRQAFGHYVLAGEVLRSPGGPLASSGFAAAVSAAIDEAPAQLDRTRPDASSEGRWWSKPAFATAVAATAAIFAVLIVQTGVQQPPAASVAASALRQAQQAFAGVPAVRSSSPTAASSQRLAGYLMAHSQFASPIGRRNVWSGVLAADPSISRVSYESAGTP